MNAASLLKVKAGVRSVSMKEARKILDRVMQLDTADAVESQLNMALAELGIEQIDSRIEK
jgi:phosphoenolpyruvate-protein kinase (PTS system EI component)